MTKALEESGKIVKSEYEKMMENVNDKFEKIIYNCEKVGVLKDAKKYDQLDIVNGRRLNNQSMDLFADIVAQLLSYKGQLK